jgi:flagellar protein FliO/FliZ
VKIARLALLALLSVSAAYADVPTSTLSPAQQAAEAAERRRLAEVAKAYEAVEPDLRDPKAGTAAPVERPLPSFASQLIQMVFMLGAVVAFAYLVLGKLLPRFFGMSEAGRRAMLAAPSRGVVEVVDRLPLDPRRSLLVVRVGGDYFLVGLAGENMSLLSRLDDSELNLPAEKPLPPKLASRFQRLLERRPEKESG